MFWEKALKGWSAPSPSVGRGGVVVGGGGGREGPARVAGAVEGGGDGPGQRGGDVVHGVLAHVDGDVLGLEQALLAGRYGLYFRFRRLSTERQRELILKLQSLFSLTYF